MGNSAHYLDLSTNHWETLSQNNFEKEWLRRDTDHDWYSPFLSIGQLFHQIGIWESSLHVSDLHSGPIITKLDE